MWLHWTFCLRVFAKASIKVVVEGALPEGSTGEGSILNIRQVSAWLMGSGIEVLSPPLSVSWRPLSGHHPLGSSLGQTTPWLLAALEPSETHEKGHLLNCLISGDTASHLLASALLESGSSSYLPGREYVMTWRIGSRGSKSSKGSRLWFEI